MKHRLIRYVEHNKAPCKFHLGIVLIDKSIPPQRRDRLRTAFRLIDGVQDVFVSAQQVDLLRWAWPHWKEVVREALDILLKELDPEGEVENKITGDCLYVHGVPVPYDGWPHGSQ